MSISTRFKRILADDQGAATVDWVALTAGVLLAGIMVVYAIFNDGVSSLVVDVNDTMATTSIAADIGTAEAINQ